MKFSCSVVAAASLLSACGATQLPRLGQIPTSPAAIADRTSLDEAAALRAEHLYQAAATVIIAADRLGIIPAAARPRLADADRKAYAAIRATRSAYAAGNASSYAAASTVAEAAIGDLLRAFKG